MNATQRPVTVLVLSCLYIAVGALGEANPPSESNWTDGNCSFSNTFFDFGRTPPSAGCADRRNSVVNVELAGQRFRRQTCCA
jgi:hypothetical protein